MIQATISTHKGTQYAPEHNRRDPTVVMKEKHIDLTKPHENWIDKDVRTAFDEIFNEAVREYNEKQKRSDRKIKDYYSKICKDSRHTPVQELIIGVYYDDYDSQICRDILRKFVDTWKERNQSLRLIGAYFHEDERSERGPHVHIDFVPVGTGYQRGMRLQCSQEKALNELGFFSKGKRGEGLASTQWIHRENGVLEGLCKEHGIEVIHPRTGDAHLKTTTYVAVQQKKDAVKKEVEKLEADLKKEKTDFNLLREKNSAVKAEIESGERELAQKRTIALKYPESPVKPQKYKELFGDVVIDKKSYEDLKNQAQQYGEMKTIAIERTVKCDRQDEKIQLLTNTVDNQRRIICDIKAENEQLRAKEAAFDLALHTIRSIADILRKEAATIDLPPIKSLLRVVKNFYGGLKALQSGDRNAEDRRTGIISDREER